MGVIGRRRRASYATVQNKKVSSGSAEISRTLGANLRIRDGDKIKIVKLGSDETDEEATGDMRLMASQPSTAESVTLSPIEDSYNELVATEGGDDISDEEIMERFVSPYLDLEDGENTVLLKKGHVLTLRDDNGRSLDFLVTNIEVDGTGNDEEEADEGKHICLLPIAALLISGYAIPRYSKHERIICVLIHLIYFSSSYSTYIAFLQTLKLSLQPLSMPLLM